MEDTPSNEQNTNLARVRNDLLTAEEVADRLSIPTKRVYRLPMHRVELGPNTVRWRPEDLDGFIESHLVAA